MPGVRRLSARRAGPVRGPVRRTWNRAAGPPGRASGASASGEPEAPPRAGAVRTRSMPRIGWIALVPVRTGHERRPPFRAARRGLTATGFPVVCAAETGRPGGLRICVRMLRAREFVHAPCRGSRPSPSGRRASCGAVVDATVRHTRRSTHLQHVAGPARPAACRSDTARLASVEIGTRQVSGVCEPAGGGFAVPVGRHRPWMSS